MNAGACAGRAGRAPRFGTRCASWTPCWQPCLQTKRAYATRTHAAALRGKAADRQTAAGVTAVQDARDKAAAASRPTVVPDGSCVRAAAGRQTRNLEAVCGKVEQAGYSPRRFALVRPVAGGPVEHTLDWSALGWLPREGVRDPVPDRERGQGSYRAERIRRRSEGEALSIILRSVSTRSRQNDASSTTPKQAFVAQATQACLGGATPVDRVCGCLERTTLREMVCDASTEPLRIREHAIDGVLQKLKEASADGTDDVHVITRLPQQRTSAPSTAASVRRHCIRPKTWPSTQRSSPSFAHLLGPRRCVSCPFGGLKGPIGHGLDQSRHGAGQDHDQTSHQQG